MKEINRKVEPDWDTEVSVSITLKELAVIYSFLCVSSTRGAQDNVDKVVKNKLDVFAGDLPYKIYESAGEILKNYGVAMKN